MMIRLSAFLFLGLYLLAATELKQIFKLGAMVRHYSEHKNQRGDLTVTDFLYMHYVTDDLDPDDDQQDRELPFKSRSWTFSGNIVPTGGTHGLRPFLFASETPVFIHPCCELSPAHGPVIWQPPQFA